MKDINTERVELVRLRLGLTKIAFAAELGIDRKTLQRIEKNGEMSSEILNTLSSFSGYPIKFFSKDTIQFPNPDGISFRSRRSLTANVRNSALAAGALAFEIDDWVHENFVLPKPSVPPYENKTPIDAALTLRANWGIGERPISNIINLLEAHGIRIFSLVENTNHLDGYSFWRNETPYVFLNTKKTAEHSRFDAAHELGHLVMHRHTGSNHKTAEDEANAFASAFLIPPNDLVAKLPRVNSLKQIIEWKKRWKVSASALNYALHKNGLVTDWQYRSNYIQLSKYGRENEPEGIIEKETSQIWQKVLQSLWLDGITLSHIAKQLDIPEQEISNLLFNIKY